MGNMETPEAMGHVAVLTLAGVIGLFGGPWGVLVGLVLIIAWIAFCAREKAKN